MDSKSQSVAVLGASANAERYSNRAVKSLLEHGYNVIPINPAGSIVHGLTCVKSIDQIEGDIGTLSIYTNPSLSTPLIESIIRLSPARIIVNPGTENSELENRCGDAGIEVISGCTLVMLETDQF